MGMGTADKRGISHLSAANILFRLIPTTTLYVKCYYYCHFTNEETEAQKFELLIQGHRAGKQWKRGESPGSLLPPCSAFPPFPSGIQSLSLFSRLQNVGYPTHAPTSLHHVLIPPPLSTCQWWAALLWPW